jgi:hypothetical protein
MSLTNKLLSGIEMSQTQADSTVVAPTIYQEFYLPPTYVRGAANSEVQVPPLTGFSVMVGVADGTGDAVVFDWEVQRFFAADGWHTIASGRTIGTPAESNRVWVDHYFLEPVTVDPDMLDDKLRIKLVTLDTGDVIDQSVDYSDSMVTIDGVKYPVTLAKNEPTFFIGNGTQGVLFWDGSNGAITYSNRQAPTGLWVGNIPGSQYTFAYTSANGTGALSGTLCWRLLAASGDDGQDFLGNSYRHSIFSHKVSNISTLDGATEDRFWFSKPNPSKFAIENLFFDVRDGLGAASVVDSVLLDPITPNVFFSVYYTNDGNPGVSPSDWNDKLWTRVPKTFKAARRDSYAFPQPIRAKYIKVEFTFLQPRSYTPGAFQQPIRYQKHPKWVLDYFLARINDQRVSEDQFVARRVDVQFDALDLAYNYYLDDLHQEPDGPVQFDSRQYQNLAAFMSQRSDISDLVDAQTMGGINTVLQPYRDGLSQQISVEDTLLNRFVASTLSVAGREGEPTQNLPVPTAVSSLDRDAVVFEQSMPVMYFYLTARHRYRELQASFDHDRAYFVGVREVAFLRERYDKATDTTQYIEVGGDSINLYSSDWVHNNTALVISDE